MRTSLIRPFELKKDSKMIQQKNLKYLLFIVLLFTLLSSCSVKQERNPPIANVIPKIDTIHDDIRIDNYFWMHDKSDPNVIEYLEAENKYAEEMMKLTRDFNRPNGRMRRTVAV